MATDTNPARGEVSFTAAGQSFKLTAHADAVAAIEAEVGALGLRDLVRRINDVNLATVKAGLVFMDADKEAVARKKVAKLKLPDLVDAATALASALLFGMQRGNEIAAKK